MGLFTSVDCKSPGLSFGWNPTKCSVWFWFRRSCHENENRSTASTSSRVLPFIRLAVFTGSTGTIEPSMSWNRIVVPFDQCQMVPRRLKELVDSQIKRTCPPGYGLTVVTAYNTSLFGVESSNQVKTTSSIVGSTSPCVVIALSCFARGGNKARI